MQAIEAHARETYPEECCGFLIGTAGDPGRVTEARRARNVAQTDRERRYVIDPLEQLRVEKQLSETGEVVLGFYHSHPEHPAEPSEFDRSHAVPWYAWYVILSIVDRTPADLRAWAFQAETSVFQAAALTVADA